MANKDWFKENWTEHNYKTGLFASLILELPALFALDVYLVYYMRNYALKLEVK